MPGKKFVNTLTTPLSHMGSQLNGKTRKFVTFSYGENMHIFMVRTFWVVPCLMTMDQPNTSNTMSLLDHIEVGHSNTQQPVLMTITQRMVEATFSLVKTSQPRQIHITSRHTSKSTLTLSRHATGISRDA